MKKIIEEAMKPEQRQQLMGLAVDVEEACLKLYKFAITDENIDSSLVSSINRLKKSVGEFITIIDKKYATNDSVDGMQDEDEQSMDLNKSSQEEKRDFIENVEIGEDKEEITEAKNKSISLKEKKEWNTSIDISKEVKSLFESYTSNGFKNSKTVKSIKILVESLKKNIPNLKNKLGITETALFEEVVSDMNNTESEEEFDECYGRMTEWANKGNKVFINVE